MRWMALKLVCIVAVLSSVSAPAQEPPKTATVDFELRKDLIFLKVGVNGEPKTFMLDTGATATLLSAEVAEELGLEETGRAAARSVNKEDSVVPIVRVDSLEIGGIIVCNLSCQTGGAVDYVREHYGEDIAGVLGADVLSRFTLTIDYRAKRLTFEQHEDKLPEAVIIQDDLFTDPNHNLTVRKPDTTWDFVVDAASVMVVSIKKRDATAVAEIMVQQVHDAPLDQIIPMLEPAVRTQVEDFRRLVSAKRQIGDHDCYVLEYTGKQADTEKQFRYALLKEKGYLYIARCSADAAGFGSFSEDFDAIVSSIQSVK